MENRNVSYVVASTIEAAKTVARLTARGELPVLYTTRDELMRAHSGLNPVQRQTYIGWRVDLNEDHTATVVTQLTR